MKQTSPLLIRLGLALCLTASFSLAAYVPAHANAGTKTEGKDGKDAKPKAPKAPKKKPPAPEGGENKEGKVGYSDAEIQLNGMMVPYRSPTGYSYQVLTVRLQLAPGDSQRAACWMAAVVHEKILMYLANAKLQPDDFEGQKRELLIKSLLDVAIKTTDRSFYSGVMLVDETTPALEPKSQTLSSQCK